MLQRPRQVEPEIIRSTEHPVGRRPRLDRQHLSQYVLLPLRGNHVIQHAQNVGLLAEHILIGIVGQQRPLPIPALVVNARAHMRRPLPVPSRRPCVSEMLLQIGCMVRAL